MIQHAADAGRGDENQVISLLPLIFGLEVSSLRRFTFKSQIEMLNVSSISGGYLLERHERTSNLFRITPRLHLIKTGKHGRGAFFQGVLATGEPVIGSIRAGNSSVSVIEKSLGEEPVFLAPPWRFANDLEGVSVAVHLERKSDDMFTVFESKTARIDGLTQAAQFEPRQNRATFVGFYLSSGTRLGISHLTLSVSSSPQFESVELRNLPEGFGCRGIARLSRSFVLVAGTVPRGGSWDKQKVVVLTVNSRTGEATKIWEQSKSDLNGGSLANISEGLFAVTTTRGALEVLRIRSKI